MAGRWTIQPAGKAARRCSRSPSPDHSFHDGDGDGDGDGVDDGDGDGDGDGDCNDSDGGYLSGEPRDGAIRCKMQFIGFSRICSTGSYCSLSWHIKQQISNQMTKNLHPGQVRVS